MWPFKSAPKTDLWSVFDGQSQVGTPAAGYVRGQTRREAIEAARAKWPGMSLHLSRVSQAVVQKLGLDRSQFEAVAARLVGEPQSPG